MGLPGSHHLRARAHGRKRSGECGRGAAGAGEKEFAGGCCGGRYAAWGLNLQQDAGSGLPLQFEGQGEIANFHLSSATRKAEIGPERVPFL